MGCKKALFRKSREWWRCRQGRGGRREGAARFPGIPNLGDVTKADWNEQEPVDVVVFGSPCQAFSVAGKRAGLDDPRGNLTLIGLGIVGRLRPRWFVWENVPGVLSLDGGRTFGTILGLMGELGYGFAYAVLDARWFGVPQRRRRVFVVGCLGDWRGPAAVLFEPESLRGDSPPSRETGKDIARPIGSSSAGGSGYRNDADTADNLIAFGGNDTRGPIDVATALDAHGGPSGRIDFESETFICGTLNASGKAAGSATQQDAETGMLIAHSLRAGGFDASEDGTGRGTPLVPIPFDTTQITSVGNYSRPAPGDPCHPLAATAHVPAIAFSAKDHGGDAGALAPTLRAGMHDKSHANAGVMPAVAIALRGRDGGGTAELSDVPSALLASQGGGDKAYVLTSLVRRLTPMECERLQGFSDGWTAIAYRGKPAADGPRYRALGNAMAVPVVRWILERLMFVDSIANYKRAA